MQQLQTTLSDKPSEFLLEALEDLEKAEQAGHEINMNTYVKINNYECEVCLAGAAMLNRTPNYDFSKAYVGLWADYYTKNEAGKLDFIDFIRVAVEQGWFLYFTFQEFGLIGNKEILFNQLKKYVYNEGTIAYKQDPQAFKERIRGVAKIFENHGN